MKISKIIAVFAIFVGLQASANVIEIELDKTQVGPGEILNVNLVATFTDPVDEFNFDFLFATDIFSFVTGTETTNLPNDGSDAIFEIADNLIGVGLGFIDFSGGFLDGEYFINFDLMANLAGESSFDLVVNTLYSYFEDQDYQLETVEQKSATVPEPVTVSAPATLGLFAIALFAFAGFRRKA
jgi:hypothetical protein